MDSNLTIVALLAALFGGLPLWVLAVSQAKIASALQELAKGRLTYDSCFTAAKAICKHRDRNARGIGIAEMFIGTPRAIDLADVWQKHLIKYPAVFDLHLDVKAMQLVRCYAEEFPNEACLFPKPKDHRKRQPQTKPAQ